jgi:hypothetical protein
VKVGYSLLLGEYIAAEALEYRDCEPFQVVCPECKEPLFKVRRDGPGDGIHYLSHYRAGDAYASECEKRVASRISGAMHHHNTESRDQKLDYFLGVFRDLLSAEPVIQYSKSMESTHKKLNRSFAFRKLRDSIYHHSMSSPLTREAFQVGVQEYLDETRNLEGLPPTGFSLAVQSRIAGDVYAHLLSAKTRVNFHALICHGYIGGWQKFEGLIGTSEGAEKIVVTRIRDGFVSLLTGGKRSGLLAWESLAATPIGYPYTREPSSYLFKIVTETFHQMIGTLVRLPYLEHLARRQSGTPSSRAP